MKKTITINIKGIIFNIDEDAFAKLNHYIESIKIHFENRDGREEIIADIESRIAELLQQKISETKQVVTINDILEVIEILGQPAEMDEEPVDEKPKSTAYQSPRKKRLFRDPDNRKLGGVAAGLAAYFVTDPLWIRLIFVLLLIGSGAGFLIYVVLWIVIPEAVTTADKLEMRGEPVNIANIEKSIKEEFETVKDKFDEYATDAKESFRRTGKHVRGNSNYIVDPVVQVLKIIARVFSILFGFIFLFIGLMLTLLAGSFFLGWDDFTLFTEVDFVHIAFENLFPLVLSGPLSLSLAPIVLSVFIAVPLIMLIYLGLRLLIGNNFRIQGLGTIAIVLWIASVVGMFYIGTRLAMDFKESQSIELTDKSFDMGNDKVLYINMIDNKPDKGLVNIELFDNPIFVTPFQSYESFYAYPTISINKSNNVNASVRVNAVAKGSTNEKAIQRAEMISYQVVFSDSSVSLPKWYSYEVEDKLRGQNVEIELQLPEGQIVYFDKSIETFMSNTHNNYWLRKGYAGNFFKMTSEGLKRYENLESHNTN